MKKTLIVGGIAAVAVFAGVVYFAREPADQSPAAVQAAKDEGPKSEAPKPAVTEPLPVTRSAKPSRPVSTDPRLAALMVSPDNALIEYFPDADGRVIKEIDKDSGSPGYMKPLREYMYAGDKVVGLTAYKYLGDQIQITRVVVTYKPDGSVDQYQESTSYEFGKKARD